MKAVSIRTKTIAEVINEVAAKYGVSYVELISHRRPAALIRARQEAYWRCTKETLASLTTIARHFGDRDHSTICKGAKAYQQIIDPSYTRRRDITSAINLLQGCGYKVSPP